MFNRILLLNRIATIFTITQSANQTITVTCDGIAHTSTFVAYTGQAWSAAVVADEGYNAGTLNISSGVVRGSESVWATEATPSVWTATMVVGSYSYSSSTFNYCGYAEYVSEPFGSLSNTNYKGFTIDELYDYNYKDSTSYTKLSFSNNSWNGFNNMYVTIGSFPETQLSRKTDSHEVEETTVYEYYFANNSLVGLSSYVGQSLPVRIRND